jgi:hypothetical protein
MHAQSGTTLLETLFAIAILAIIGSLAFLPFSGRLFETRSSVTVFDELLAHARTLASANGGVATISFATSPSGSGTVVALSPPDIPPETLRADVSEATLGMPPFTISVDAYGHALAPEPCPAAGGFTLTLSAGPASETRFLPCPVEAAGSPEPPGTPPP